MLAVAREDRIRGMTERTEALRLARRYIWWQEPNETLEDSARLLCQIMARATPEDYVAALRVWGRPAIREALQHALPGWIDDRSWYFWRRHFQLQELPPPTRRFDAAST